MCVQRRDTRTELNLFDVWVITIQVETVHNGITIKPYNLIPY